MLDLDGAFVRHHLLQAPYFVRTEDCQLEKKLLPSRTLDPIRFCSGVMNKLP